MGQLDRMLVPERLLVVFSAAKPPVLVEPARQEQRPGCREYDGIAHAEMTAGAFLRQHRVVFQQLVERFVYEDIGIEIDTAMIDELRHRRGPLIGNGAGWWSFVHVDDAASAAVAAIEHGKAGQIYNIVDDEPAQVSAWLPALAGILGAKPPFHIPA